MPHGCSKPLGYRYVHLDTDEVTFAGRQPGHLVRRGARQLREPLAAEERPARDRRAASASTTPRTDERFRESVRSAFSRLRRCARRSPARSSSSSTRCCRTTRTSSARAASRSTFPSTSDEATSTRRLGMRYYLRQLRVRRAASCSDAVDAIRAHSEATARDRDPGRRGLPGRRHHLRRARRCSDIRVKGLLALSLPGVREAARARAAQHRQHAALRLQPAASGRTTRCCRATSYPEGDYPYQFEEMRVR